MVKTLRRRLADGRTRKLIATIFAGKMLGVIAMLFVVNQIAGFIDTPASAQAVTHQANDLVNPVNTVWVLVTAFLVFFMQAGFMALEAGFARSRETVNVLIECVFDTCLCGLLFWAIGFAFSSAKATGFIGHQFFLLHGCPRDVRLDRRRVPRVLAVPVRVRRHLLDGHVGRDGRSHRVQGRPALQRSASPASSTRSSDTGCGVRAAGSAP